MSNTSILPQLPPEEWDSSIAHMGTGFAAGLNVYRTMAHHPQLLAAWAALRDHIVSHSALGAVRNEVIILRAGFRHGCEYEWQQHIERARAVGLDDSRIVTIMGPKEAMSPEDRLLTDAVDELFETSRLSPRTRQALYDTYGPKPLLDLMATVGFYTTLAFMLNSFEVPLDADIRDRLEARPLYE